MEKEIEHDSDSNHEMHSYKDSLNSEEEFDDSLGTYEAQMVYYPFKEDLVLSSNIDAASINAKILTTDTGKSNKARVLSVGLSPHLNQLTYCVTNRNFSLMRKQKRKELRR